MNGPYDQVVRIMLANCLSYLDHKQSFGIDELITRTEAVLDIAKAVRAQEREADGK